MYAGCTEVVGFFPLYCHDVCYCNLSQSQLYTGLGRSDGSAAKFLYENQ